MTRVLEAADTLRSAEAESTELSWRLNVGPAQLSTPKRIWYSKGREHKPSATKQAADGKRFVHKSWTGTKTMARVPGILRDADTVKTEAGGTRATSPQRVSNEGLPKSIAQRWNRLRGGPKNKFIMTNRPLTTDRPSYRSQAHPLPQGFISQVLPEPNKLRYGVGVSTRLRSDLQAYLISVMQQDKAPWLGKAAPTNAAQIDTPPNRPDPAKTGLYKSNPLCRGPDLAQKRLQSTNLIHTDEDLIQIFIKLIEGKHYCMRLRKATSISDLKKEIQGRHGIPERLQNLIYTGYSLQDNKTLQHYGIANDSTINLTLRLRGGSSGTSSKNTGSFRDAVKGKGEKMKNKAAPTTELPGPYIVEQKPESPTLQVTMSEVTDLHTDLSNTTVICRFNGFWPKSDALHQWIYSTWTPNCEIYLCPKGFFIVRFDTEQERDSIIKQGPWFWGSAGLFTTPWFSDFDATTMVVSTMPVWVRLHGLPLHFWHQKVLIAIGNSLGKFLKTDEDRAIRGIFTFARICVEVDLSQGLPDHIALNFNNTQWIQ